MKIVEHILIPSDGIHIRINATAGIEAVALESQAFPLGEGMHNLRFRFCMQDIKGDRPLITVQVIVQPRIIRHKKRS